MQDIKRRYSVQVKEMSDILLEDVFLPLHIVLDREDITDGNYIMNYFKRLVLDSIYYDGQLQSLYTKMPDSFREFLELFQKMY